MNKYLSESFAYVLTCKLKAKTLCTSEVSTQQPFLMNQVFYIQASLLYALENSESGELQRACNIT